MGAWQSAGYRRWGRPSGSLTAAGDLIAGNNSNVAWGNSHEAILGNNTNEYMSFMTNNTEHMRLDTNGNLGIGAPGQALDVQGTVRATNFIGNGAGITGVTAVPAGGNNAVQYTNGVVTLGDETKFSFNGNNVGIGTTNGILPLDVRGGGYFSSNVGIGSTAPGQALDVTGTVRMTGLTMSGSSAFNRFMS